MRNSLAISRASPEAYASLAHLHYRAGSPATLAGVWGARIGRDLAGVLVVSAPVLNGPWRGLAWGPGFDASPRAVNRSVRCISRLIIDPRFRGIGIATALVRAYLASPLTPCTEALAAMGRACPCFERAGMRAVAFPPSRRDRRLSHRLAVLGIDPCRLVHAPTCGALLREHASLGPALRRWANDSRATRARRDADPIDLAVCAAAALASPRVAYTAP